MVPYWFFRSSCMDDVFCWRSLENRGSFVLRIDIRVIIMIRVRGVVSCGAAIGTWKRIFVDFAVGLEVFLLIKVHCNILSSLRLSFINHRNCAEVPFAINISCSFFWSKIFRSLSYFDFSLSFSFSSIKVFLVCSQLEFVSYLSRSPTFFYRLTIVSLFF